MHFYRHLQLRAQNQPAWHLLLLQAAFLTETGVDGSGELFVTNWNHFKSTNIELSGKLGLTGVAFIHNKHIVIYMKYIGIR